MINMMLGVMMMLNDKQKKRNYKHERKKLRIKSKKRKKNYEEKGI